MSGLGHNKGPILNTGPGWHRHCWTEARRALLPGLPIEVIRLRVERAKELGLNYRTYATVRATTGHGIVAFLFSTNALRLFREPLALPQAHAETLSRLRNCDQILAAYRPLDPARVLAHLADVDHVAFRAGLASPGFADSWSKTRDHLTTSMAACGVVPRGVVVIGDTAIEREWVAAGRMAGFVSAETYFR